MNKTLWIIANWKSNKTISEALDWVSKVGPQIPKKENLKVVVCPTFSCLEEVKKVVQVGNFPLMVGSQDLSPFDTGAYTGEEAARVLKDFVDLAILGHSERKQNFGETDEMVAKKVLQAIENNIIPLVCVQSEETPIPDKCKMIAYEPIWAISSTPGTKGADSPLDANRVAGIFKEKNPELEVIYGGSVDSSNVKGFITCENINGVLPGRASLDVEEFIKIVKECAVETT